MCVEVWGACCGGWEGRQRATVEAASWSSALNPNCRSSAFKASNVSISQSLSSNLESKAGWTGQDGGDKGSVALPVVVFKAFTVSMSQSLSSNLRSKAGWIGQDGGSKRTVALEVWSSKGT